MSLYKQAGSSEGMKAGKEYIALTPSRHLRPFPCSFTSNAGFGPMGTSK